MVVHPNALKHGLTAVQVQSAWENYLVGAVRIPGELEVRIGLTPEGREVELVGSLLADGSWLIFHAMTPPTKQVRTEIDKALRRRR